MKSQKFREFYRGYIGALLYQILKWIIKNWMNPKPFIKRFLPVIVGRQDPGDWLSGEQIRWATSEQAVLNLEMKSSDKYSNDKSDSVNVRKGPFIFGSLEVSYVSLSKIRRLHLKKENSSDIPLFKFFRMNHPITLVNSIIVSRSFADLKFENPHQIQNERQTARYFSFSLNFRVQVISTVQDHRTQAVTVFQTGLAVSAMFCFAVLGNGYMPIWR